MRFIIKWGLMCTGAIIGGLVLFAFARTWNKAEIEFLIHINEELVQQSLFGESPTFAIWLEDPKGLTHTAYVTRRAALGDWEGKREVPNALPMWFEINKTEKRRKSHDAEIIRDEMITTGATPMPGYFRTRVRVNPGSKWICWIEVNLAGDFNDVYQEFNAEKNILDEYSTGQPALLYKTEIEILKDRIVHPEIIGMCVFNKENQVVVEPLHGITTATGVFDEISIAVVRPKPRIIEKPYLMLNLLNCRLKVFIRMSVKPLRFRRGGI